MKIDQFGSNMMKPPQPTSDATVWLRSGEQFKGRVLSYDLNGLLLLQPNNGRPFIIDIGEIAAVQFSP